jgi:NDP-sugar pyrophosphorylase family protein
MTRKTLFVLMASGTAAIAFVGARLYDGDRAEPARTLVVGSASVRWPSETIRDWADFADEVVVLHVVSEEALPASAEVLENGEGLIGRRVTARVESTVWRNPGSPSLERTVSFTTWGWVVHDGVRIPTVDSSSARIEVGDRVVAPLLMAPEGEWAALAPSAVIKLDRGRMISR